MSAVALPAEGGPAALCIMGPTAAGKTELAVWLAARGPFEIISVDSAMVYRRMDIGTGKPTPEVLARAPHRLIDIREPHESYSVAHFLDDAEAAISEIHRAGRTPLLVGGTGLYFAALLRGLSPMPPADPGVRRELSGDAAREGWAAMHARLARLDPAAAARIHPNDPQRIQRALEVCIVSGRPLSRLHAEGRRPGSGARLHPLVLDVPDRSELHTRIRVRFAAMLERGLADEVRALRADPRLSLALPAMRAVGYRQVWQWLDGGTSFEAMSEAALTATRRLAKRQLTWLRTQVRGTRFDAGARGLKDEVLCCIEARLGRLAP